jgi:hypothetical protein
MAYLLPRFYSGAPSVALSTELSSPSEWEQQSLPSISRVPFKIYIYLKEVDCVTPPYYCNYIMYAALEAQFISETLMSTGFLSTWSMIRCAQELQYI